MNDAFCVTRPGRPWRACGGPWSSSWSPGWRLSTPAPPPAQVRSAPAVHRRRRRRQPITVGFQPDVVIVKSVTAAGEAVIRTSTMPAGETYNRR